MYLLRNFFAIKMSSVVNPNTPHSAPVCTMFNEITQYLKFFVSSTGVKMIIMMTSSSNFANILRGSI